MPEFHETPMGQEYYQVQLPLLIKAIASLANELKRANDLKVRELEKHF